MIKLPRYVILFERACGVIAGYLLTFCSSCGVHSALCCVSICALGAPYLARLII
ncbi:hypothetical protein ANAPC1_00577 [Anaplasma phagocytophilum]|uniref:Uncharacterized protein n=2 Tax=Anaplasma phagocytophilum TaxID=948 RepID=A0AA45ZHE1_ANAPH|nr:putative membrane protein [Anaplasma phagocytophilum str. ApNP]SBO14230.1 hypothetical protein ANAPC1_00577 [Anaplasma phagocytophilum]SBO31239.1 hypothetical protein ANAPC4_00430 [Anaplasma phagocytophilum]SBO31427.1 hypothetical protein ANAPC2_00651 [Anaplasma phagocytophilum]SBO31497.1 hypothetical protein ANAPC3_00549 [Anaplasma phagocytophilum]